MKIKQVPVDDILPYDNNPREIAPNVITVIAKSIKKYGFRQPLVINNDHSVIVGHGRLLAAREIGLETVPCEIVDMDEDTARAYRLDDNRIGEMAKWDVPKLVEEIDILPEDMLVGWNRDELDDIIANMLDEDEEYDDEDDEEGDSGGIRMSTGDDDDDDDSEDIGVIETPLDDDDPYVKMVTLKIRVPKKHAAGVREVIEYAINEYMIEAGEE